MGKSPCIGGSRLLEEEEGVMPTFPNGKRIPVWKGSW